MSKIYIKNLLVALKYFRKLRLFLRCLGGGVFVFLYLFLSFVLIQKKNKEKIKPADKELQNYGSLR